MRLWQIVSEQPQCTLLTDSVCVRETGKTMTNPRVTSPKEVRDRKASAGDDANVNGSTPKSKKRGKAAKASGSAEDSAGLTTSQESASTTNTGAPRKRAAVTKEKVVTHALPTSMKECSEADYMLLLAKDRGNKTWAEIRTLWKTRTGEDVENTLPLLARRIAIIRL